MGCATAIMRPYVGQQQDWPTVEGSIVNTKYDLPIFNSLPPVPYDILGELRIESPFYAQPEEQHMATLTQKARNIGAQALVLVDGQIFFGVNYGGRSKDKTETTTMPSAALSQVNRFLPESFRPGVSVLAIRWVQGAPAGLPAKYANLSSSFKPSPKPPEPKKEIKTTTPTPKKPATKSNIAPANPVTTPVPSVTSTNKPAAIKKTVKPDEAR